MCVVKWTWRGADWIVWFHWKWNLFPGFILQYNYLSNSRCIVAFSWFVVLELFFLFILQHYLIDGGST